MSTHCRACGRLMEGQGDICEACKENIRAEAMGKHRRVAKQTPKEAGKLDMGDKKRVKNKKSSSTPQDEEAEKNPHHFKSMAEYLEYLKGKRGR